jgi:amino acid transporter
MSISPFAGLKRLLVGSPISTAHAEHERLSRLTGLAVLSSDALSSVAYATEEILRVLMVGGAAALTLSTPVSLVIAILLLTVVFSYRQTIFAYPSGGGAYLVAKDNLGETPALIAASSLLIDYTLTVAVSIAAGVAAVTSAVPTLHVSRVELSLIFMVLLAVGNLRGIRESGRIFSVPTYFFIGGMLLLLGVGAWRWTTGAIVPFEGHAAEALPVNTLGWFAILTAFANGCTAMTGVEAVSNGVPAFRKPESRNAAATLVVMAVLAVTMFVGITLLAHAYVIVPNDSETVVSQIARAVFGGRGWMYYMIQAGTMLILVLAANTAYADFPRLASIVSRDRYLPRQFMNQGDRLAFSNGIVVLSVCAGLLLVVFGGDTHALIPLYMIGVFVSFTLSQFGMVVHWRRLRESGWRTSAVINGFGAIVTAIVLVIVASTKAAEGAWIILLLIPALVVMFRVTRQHYDHVASQLSVRDFAPLPKLRNIVLLPVSGVHRAVLQALHYAHTLSDDVRALYVSTDAQSLALVRKDWEKWGEGVQLVVLDSPYRSVMQPLLNYITELEASEPDAYVTIVLAEFVPARWWQHLLHNQRALLLKGALLFRPNTVVTNVPFHLAR